MSMRDRLERGAPPLKDLIEWFDQVTEAVNTLISVTLTGEAPHKANDTANAVSTADASTSGGLESVCNLVNEADVDYAAHLASTSYHLAADSTNVMTYKTPAYLVNELGANLKTKYNLHHVYTVSSCHAGSGDPNTVTASTASLSKAAAVALLNDIKAMMVAHCANVTSCHGAADTTSMASVPADLTSVSTWAQCQAMVDALRTAYEAHRVLTAGSVHGAADAANGATVAAVGSLQTVVNNHLTQLKTQFNAHIIYMTSHYVKDDSMAVSTAAATTLATSIALSNALKSSYNNHISRASESGLTVPTLDEL